MRGDNGIVVLAGWLTFGVALLAAYWALPRGLGAIYFPNWPLARFVTFAAVIAIAAIPVSFVLAVRLTIIRRKRPQVRMLAELACLYATLGLPFSPGGS